MKRSREKQGTPETQPGMAHKRRFHDLLSAALVLMRLVLAFACGWLLAFLFTSLIAPRIETNGTVLFFVLFPPVLGIATTATVDRQNQHLTLLSIGTGLLVLSGIYAYRFPLASQDDAAFNAMCVTNGLHCHVGPVDVALLNLFLVYGIVVVLLCAGITGLLIERNLKQEDHSLSR